jgi:uncharacterized lipoprotein YddW (UPF0748 family)
MMNLRTPAVLLLILTILSVACSKGTGSNPAPPTPPVPPTPPPTTPVWDTTAYRGVWITTTASTALDSRDNIRQTVATCKTGGINHLFVVVYNNARTTYPSTVMQNLIGKRILERYEGRDPLQ